MISLRKHIDNYRDRPSDPPQPTVRIADLSQDPALNAFRNALIAIGTCGQRAVPTAGAGLTLKLAEIDRDLERHVTPEVLNKTSERVRAELSEWADCALRHHNDNEREIKEIMDVVARAAEAVGTRDEKYSREIGTLTGKMRSIADLKDISAIRSAIIDSTAILKSCVEKMVQDGKASLRDLTAEVDDYRSRLEESERTASLDPLTHLANRRAFEKALAARMAAREKIAVILIDLNHFKTVNDQHGHLAGDDLLRQFSAELRAQFTSTDTVCRWGGDEFAVIIAGQAKDAAERVERINRWVLGEYKVNVASKTVKLIVKAAIGVVEWNGKETGLELLSRADKGLYRSKDAQNTGSSQRSLSRPVPA